MDSEVLLVGALVIGVALLYFSSSRTKLAVSEQIPEGSRLFHRT
jgi:hypothetical protein